VGLGVGFNNQTGGYKTMEKRDKKRLDEIVGKLAGLNSTSDLSAREQSDYERLTAQWEQEQPKAREKYGF
tara:strand:- start:459 stop:668 length:210 start_codon:yes stop_codon:yes gene_type:complete